MNLAYPHTGNQEFDDQFVELVEGNSKYELAYKIVSLNELARYNKAEAINYKATLNRLKAKAEHYIDIANVTWKPEVWAYKVVGMLVNRVKEAIEAQKAEQRQAEVRRWEALQIASATEEFTFGYNEGLTTNLVDGKRFQESEYYALGLVAGTLVNKNNLQVELSGLLDQLEEWVIGLAPSGGVLNQAKVMVGLAVPEPEVDESEDTYEWDDYDYTNYYSYDDYYASYKEALAVG